jgi:hypothetical protein
MELSLVPLFPFLPFLPLIRLDPFLQFPTCDVHRRATEVLFLVWSAFEAAAEHDLSGSELL